MVDQYHDMADARLYDGCVYCGGDDETVDHVPSRVFLDEPYPENLPVVPSCIRCNNGFSRDEEYIACVLETIIAGTTDPDHIRRPRIARTLRRSSRLRAMIDEGRSENDGEVLWHIDPDRLKNVVLKLARGHAVFEQSMRFRHEPHHYAVAPLHLLDVADREAFEAPDIPQLWGEVGSRYMQRTSVVELKLRAADGTESVVRFPLNDWIEVQPDRYSYLTASTGDGVNVRFVIAGYLACEVTWSSEF